MAPQLPANPKAGQPPPSPSGRPVHLQPISDGGHRPAGSAGGALPSTPGKSNLSLGQPGWAASAAGAGGSALQRAASEASEPAAAQQQQMQQMQQQQQMQAQALAQMQQHQQQLLQEQQEASDADNIKVVVRLRPLFPAEAAKGASNVVQVYESCTSLKVVVPGPAGSTMHRDFGFHACLAPDTSQADVMVLCGIQQLLDAALEGYHVTIFAYGQTGSGKTHTMSGKDDDGGGGGGEGDALDGIVGRAVAYLFHQVHARKDARFSLKASCLEIYNEGCYDLVAYSPRAKPLPVKWDAAYGFYVQGLKVVPCSQQRTMMEVIHTGAKHRRVGSHRLNAESSRSHAITTVYCEAIPTDPGSYDYGTVRYGKVSFVDLAGSERVKDSMSEAAMLKETININKSLSVLGKVISTLAERDAAGTTTHVPYRDSKLTKLLMDSLGGSALTLMIACCSPSSLQVEETLSTLSYATRAKNIHNRPTVQYDPREAQISQLRREIELLRQENGLLKEQLRGCTPGGGSLHSSLPATPDGTHHLGLPKLLGRPSALGIPGGGGSTGSSPVADLGGSPRSLPLAFEQQLSGVARANSSPDLPRALGLGGSGSGSPEQLLRSSLNEIELRIAAAGARQPGGGGSGGGGGAAAAAGSSMLSHGDLLRRLRETQALLIKFSEENSRLARDNDKLQAGRNMLGAEHAAVLDEIELLRSKLTLLEQNVLSAAAAGTEADGGDGAGAGAGGAAGLGSMASLLASIGLAEQGIGLAEVGPGGGPAERSRADDEEWWQGAGSSGSGAGTGVAVSSARSAAEPQAGGSARSDHGGGSGGAPFPAAGPPAHEALALAAAGAARPASLKGRSGLSSAGHGGGGINVAAAARSVINRTSLAGSLRRVSADAGVTDDSITVSNSAGLAVLLSGSGRQAAGGGDKGGGVLAGTVAAGAAAGSAARRTPPHQPF